MSVSQGTKIQASEFNTLADLIDDWFSDGCSSCSFGDAAQRFGWGGSSIASVSQGQSILATKMNAMTDRVNIGVNIVDGVSGTLSQVSSGTKILASHYNDIETKESAIRALNNTIDAAETSLHAGVTTDSSSAWALSIEATIRFTFTDFDEARYFFNSGGAFLFNLSLVGATTGNATAWANLLSTMGTLVFTDNNFSQTGTGGSTTGEGYYDSTTSFQQIFIQDPSGAYAYAYAQNELLVYVKRNTAGNVIDVKIRLQDDEPGIVDGVLTLTNQYRKLDDQSSGAASLSIAAPVVTVEDPLQF